MSEQSGPGGRAAPEALRRAVEIFFDQALALDRVFGRTVKESALGTMGYRRDMCLALKAQQHCRTTLRILLALEEERKAEEKSRDSSERTDGQPESCA